MAQTAISNRQRKLLKKGRPRLFAVPRQPNGQPSRAKANVSEAYSFLAPSLVKQMAQNPIDQLEQRGDITADQARAAFAWIADRGRTGLPYTAPPTLNLNSVRAAGDLRDDIGATRRYNEACHVLKNRCGVYGHMLAFEMIIDGRMNDVITNYLWRVDNKQDPAPRQVLTWKHLLLAFKELERHYAAQPMRKVRSKRLLDAPRDAVQLSERRELPAADAETGDFPVPTMRAPRETPARRDGWGGNVA